MHAANAFLHGAVAAVLEPHSPPASQGAACNPGLSSGGGKQRSLALELPAFLRNGARAKPRAQNMLTLDRSIAQAEDCDACPREDVCQQTALSGRNKLGAGVYYIVAKDKKNNVAISPNCLSEKKKKT